MYKRLRFPMGKVPSGAQMLADASSAYSSEVSLHFARLQKSGCLAQLACRRRLG